MNTRPTEIDIEMARTILGAMGHVKVARQDTCESILFYRREGLRHQGTRRFYWLANIAGARMAGRARAHATEAWHLWKRHAGEPCHCGSLTQCAQDRVDARNHAELAVEMARVLMKNPEPHR